MSQRRTFISDQASAKGTEQTLTFDLACLLASVIPSGSGRPSTRSRPWRMVCPRVGDDGQITTVRKFPERTHAAGSIAVLPRKSKSIFLKARLATRPYRRISTRRTTRSIQLQCIGYRKKMRLDQSKSTGSLQGLEIPHAGMGVNSHATAPRPFLATSVSNFSEAPRGRFSLRSHRLTSPVATLR